MSGKICFIPVSGPGSELGLLAGRIRNEESVVEIRSIYRPEWYIARRVVFDVSRATARYDFDLKKKVGYADHVHSFIRGARSFVRMQIRSRKSMLKELEQLCANSLEWVKLYSRADYVQMERAKLLAEEFVRFAHNTKCSADDHLDFLVQCHKNQQRNRRAWLFDSKTFDPDGLALYLASTFNETRLSAAHDFNLNLGGLLRWTYSGLASFTTAIEMASQDFKYFCVDGNSREQVIKQILNLYSVDIEEEDLGPLKACLIQTPSRSIIYANRNLTADLRELAFFHELGHLLLGHQAASDYGLDPEYMATLRVKDKFARQESEADTFAKLWSHVLSGLFEHLIWSSKSLHATESQNAQSREPFKRARTGQYGSEPEGVVS